jgi:hypothetical protein
MVEVVDLDELKQFYDLKELKQELQAHIDKRHCELLRAQAAHFEALFNRFKTEFREVHQPSTVLPVVSNPPRGKVKALRFARKKESDPVDQSLLESFLPEDICCDLSCVPSERNENDLEVSLDDEHVIPDSLVDEQKREKLRGEKNMWKNSHSTGQVPPEWQNNEDAAFAKPKQSSPL